MPDLSDDVFRLSVLRPLEARILRETGNRFERLVALSADGTVLSTFDGGPTEIVIPQDHVRRLAGSVTLLTHNHPGGRPFTIDDLLGAIALSAREINAFGPAVRYRLYLSAPSAAWPRRAEVLARLTRLRRRLEQIVAPHIVSGSVTASVGETLLRHRMWELFAQQSRGGIHYVVETR